MAQQVKALAKAGDLSSLPRTHVVGENDPEICPLAINKQVLKKKNSCPDMVVHTFNTSTWEAGAGSCP